MKRHLLFLVNPIAGTRSKDSLSEYLAKTCTAAGVSHSFVESTRQMDAQSLKQLIEEHNATDLVACGGDGTVNLAASAVQHSSINLGIIAVGSGNGLARGAGIPLKPSQALALILTGKTLKIDAFTINGHFSCMLSGLGFDAAVAERFAKSNRRGLMSYTTQTLIEFFKANPYQFEIKLPEFSFFTDAFFVSVANSNQFGNNVTIAPKASLTDGLLDLVIVQKMPKSGMPLAILKQIRGNNHLHNLAESIGKQHVLYLQTPSVEISNIKLAPMHVDGDPCETAKTIHAQVLPGSLQLFVP